MATKGMTDTAFDVRKVGLMEHEGYGRAVGRLEELKRELAAAQARYEEARTTPKSNVEVLAESLVTAGDEARETQSIKTVLERRQANPDINRLYEETRILTKAVQLQEAAARNARGEAQGAAVRKYDLNGKVLQHARRIAAAVAELAAAQKEHRDFIRCLEAREVFISGVAYMHDPGEAGIDATGVQGPRAHWLAALRGRGIDVGS